MVDLNNAGFKTFKIWLCKCCACLSGLKDAHNVTLMWFCIVVYPEGDDMQYQLEHFQQALTNRRYICLKK